MGKKRSLLNLLLVIALLAVPAFAASEDQGPLAGVMKAFLVEKDAKGEEVLVETDRIYPKQTIEYVLAYENVSPEPLKSLNLVGPIPGDTSYISKSASENFSLSPQFSIDQGNTFHSEPVLYKETLADGKVVERVATPGMYTHVRWSLDSLGSGKTAKLRYRVSVK